MQALLGIKQILGQRAVSASEAATNRKNLDAAIAAGKRTTLRPLRPRPEIPALLPVSRSTWWQGVARGRYPAPVKVGRRSLWRREDIAALLDQLTAQGSAR